MGREGLHTRKAKRSGALRTIANWDSKCGWEAICSIVGSLRWKMDSPRFDKPSCGLGLRVFSGIPIFVFCHAAIDEQG